MHAARTTAVLLLAALHAPAQTKILAHDDGKMAGRQSSAGTGHVIAFKAPKGRWWLGAVRIYGARYGRGYDPADTTFTVSVCDAALRATTSTEAAYEEFRIGRFAWVDVPLTDPPQLAGEFRIVVAFDPTRTKGVYVGWAAAEQTHSSYGLPGGRTRPCPAGREWMIRAVLTKRAPRKRSVQTTPPRGRTAVYAKDFEFLAKRIRGNYPAFDKKGIDWGAIVKEERAVFRQAQNDREHLRNVHRLLAKLQDSHSDVTESRVRVHLPAFDGLYGGGLWIAGDRGRLVLRDWLPQHQLAGKLVRGAELISIDGQPAQRVHRAVRDRLREWHGWSSTHFLDARLSTQFFPFGEKRKLRVRFLLPVSGTVQDLELPRWGPRGKSLSRQARTMPPGLAAEGHAAATELADGIGYLRILGSMNEATEKAFHAALDTLESAEAILLDCRGMGGGSDHPAWRMAGRFFEHRTSNGTAGHIVPTGRWQFTGPLVMLQDEREGSSAETFTWAMVETGRAVSVGRPTAGMTIIPRVFRLPSGIASFRLGVHDRKTPIRGVQPEGAGTPPDVLVPYEPLLLQQHADPIRAIALALLQRMKAGLDKERLVAAFAGLLEGDVGKLRRAGKKTLDALPASLGGFVPSAIDWEIRLQNHEASPAPDFPRASARLERWAAVARFLGEDESAKRAERAVAAWRR